MAKWPFDVPIEKLDAPSLRVLLRHPGFASEKAMQEHFERHCKSLGVYNYHTRRSDRSVKGFPDNVTLVEDRKGHVTVIFSELKKAGAKATPDQQTVEDLLRKVKRLIVFDRPIEPVHYPGLLAAVMDGLAGWPLHLRVYPGNEPDGSDHLPIEGDLLLGEWNS